MALATVLASGAGLLWGIFTVILAGIAQLVVFLPDNADAPTQNLVILKDGTPLVQTAEKLNVGYRTLDGKSYAIAANPEFESGMQLDRPIEIERHNATSWRKRVIQISRKGPVAWSFLSDGRLEGWSYFVGYDRETRLLVGFIGRNGFQTEKPPLEDQFPVDRRLVSECRAVVVPIVTYSDATVDAKFDLWATVYLLSDDGLVKINLAQRTAKLVRKDIAFVSAVAQNDTIVIRTPTSILRLNDKGEQIAEYPLPDALLNASDLHFRELPGKEVLLYDVASQPCSQRPLFVGTARFDSLANLFWFDSTGKTVRNEQVRLERNVVQMGDLPEKLMISVVVPSPGALVGFVSSILWQRFEFDLPHIQSAIVEWWPALVLTLAISILFASLCYRRQRKYGLPWTGMWTTLVLVFGAPAYLGYRLHCEWPSRLPCPGCGQRVPRDREACLVCGKSFPAPAPLGIEVFA